jgi:chromosome segregation ATPase
LMVRHKKAVEQHEADVQQKLLLSNNWAQSEAKLAEQIKVNMALETNLTDRISELKTTSEKLVDVSGSLAKAEAEVKTAQEELAKRDAKISELENQREDMTKKMTELNGSITTLEGQIADTEKKLASSEGDREFLLKELKRLQTEKAELERQFNDLAILREQVKKLKDELSISRRLDWIRRGLYGLTERKGAELLQRGVVLQPVQTNYNLDVELRRGGGARITAPTNKPASTNKPAPANAVPK